MAYVSLCTLENCSVKLFEAVNATRQQPWGEIGDLLAGPLRCETLTIQRRYEQIMRQPTGSRFARPRQMNQGVRVDVSFLYEFEVDDVGTQFTFEMVRNRVGYLQVLMPEIGLAGVQVGYLFYGVTIPSDDLSSQEGITFNRSLSFDSWFYKRTDVLNIEPIFGN